MQKLQINATLFNRLFPESSRREMEQRLAYALLWGDPDKLPETNLEYFAHLSDYAGRAKDLPPSIKPMNDLFPPNLAVLDYMVKFVDHNRGRVLDFACGLGGLVVRLWQLGFCAYGFDRWGQLSKQMARRFSADYDVVSDWILDALDEPRGSLAIEPATLVFVGGHWDWITPDDARAIFTPTLRRVLVDVNYSPKAIAGFDLAAQYEGLLDVFERSQ